MKRVILVFIILLLLISCSDKQEINNYDNILDFEISSPMENQIQYVDDFRLDKIWLDVDYGDYKEQIILTESMINKKDLSLLTQPGEHYINITLGDLSKKIFIVLYGSSDKYYCVNIDGEAKNVKARSVYELQAPEKSNQYFAGWFIDQELTQPYNGEEVYNIYAKYSNSKMHRVRFYYQNIIIKEEYVADGKSATPPIMKSYNDYTFSHWNKEFNNIVEDTDIFAVYKQNYYEVIFYDINNNIISRQVIEKGGKAVPPKLEEIEDKVFIGWSKDYNNISKSTNIYPLYSNKQEMYRVRFYRDSFEDANFMYEEYVEKGGSISSVNYEIKNYELIQISHNLTNINQDLNVICTYQIMENSFYINGILSTKLPIDQDFPPAVFNNGEMGIWEKNDKIENRYDLVEFKKYKKIKLSFENESLSVSIYDFLSFNPLIYVATKTNNFDFFEWYYDKELTIKITDYSELYQSNLDIIYGKHVIPEIDYLSKYKIELVEIDEIKGYRFSAQYKGNNGICYIPDEYNGLPVISINYDLIDFSEHLFVGKNVIDIYIEQYEEAVYYNQRLVVHEDNPKYYDIDGMLYERGLNKDKLIRYSVNHNNNYYMNLVPDFRLPNNTVLAMNCFNCNFFNNLYITEGCEFEGFTDFVNVNYLHISKDIKELILAPNRQGGTINYLIFEEGSELERLESNILLSIKNEFTLPYSVKYLEARTQTEILMCNYDKMIIPEDHPYFQVKDNMILDQSGTVLIGLYRNKEYDTFVVPDYIEALFIGCFFDTKINKLIFDYSVDYVIEYNNCKPISYQHINHNPFMNRTDYINEIVILNKPTEPDIPGLEYNKNYVYDEKGKLFSEDWVSYEENGDYTQVSIYYDISSCVRYLITHHKKMDLNIWLIDYQEESWYYEYGYSDSIVTENIIENGIIINSIQKYYSTDKKVLRTYSFTDYFYDDNGNLKYTITKEYNNADIFINYTESYYDEKCRNVKNVRVLYDSTGVFREKYIQNIIYDGESISKEIYTYYDINNNVISYNETTY